MTPAVPTEDLMNNDAKERSLLAIIAKQEFALLKYTKHSAPLHC